MNDPQAEGHMASYIGRRKFLATLSERRHRGLARRAAGAENAATFFSRQRWRCGGQLFSEPGEGACCPAPGRQHLRTQYGQRASSQPRPRARRNRPAAPLRNYYWFWFWFWFWFWPCPAD